MKQVLLFICLMLALPSSAGQTTDSLYQILESALSHRADYSLRKETGIDSLKRLAASASPGHSRYELYNQIYKEYYTYKFDSAMHYVDLKEAEARHLGHEPFITQSIIHRSVLLTTAGYFSESVHNLDSLRSVSPLGGALLEEYYYAYEWAYSMWAEYADDQVYAPRYYAAEMLYQDSLIHLLPETSPLHHYWKAENYYRKQRYAEAETAYFKALQDIPVNHRFYAMVTYGLAITYQRMGRMDDCERYLIRAAISDQVCPLKENLALQQLALYIFENDDTEASRANRYLNVSMEDAVFYNNRLRLLEIARKFPSIVGAYQAQIHEKNLRLHISLFCISLLVVGLMAALYFIRRQLLHIRARRQVLYVLNAQLKASNRSREEYVSLFMDLCAAYIEKLGKFHDLVKRKVKAHQTDDLLKLANASRLSDADAKEFFPSNPQLSSRSFLGTKLMFTTGG